MGMLLIPLLSHKTAVSSIASASRLSKCAVSDQNRSFSIFQPVAIIYFDFQKDFAIHVHKRLLRILGESESRSPLREGTKADNK